MLGKFERRYFSGDEKIWLGRYRNLNNILHWHNECELINIVSGTAEIRIGEETFLAKAGDCFFCSAEEMHCIVSKNETLIDIMIFHKDLLNKITNQYSLVSARLSNGEKIIEKMRGIRKITSPKPRFYAETLENFTKDILLYIFNNNETVLRQNKSRLNKKIIDKINRDFATITYNEIVSFSGYSHSHFSKIFKELTGMTFSDYLNYVKTEHAVFLLQNNTELSITDISLKCGFTTIRNFNRVFKHITGFSPRALPKDFVSDINIGTYDKETFDPTSETSILL